MNDSQEKNMLPDDLVKTLNTHLFPIIGCCYTVHKELGIGLEEAIYNEALGLELKDQEVPHENEKLLPCFYKGHQLEKTYRMDIVCYDDVILELKSVSELVPQHREQLFNYMRLTKMPIGLLINFNARKIIPEKYYLDVEADKICRFY